MLKVEVVSAQDGSHPPFDLEVWDSTCCPRNDGNPVSVTVTTGTNVLVSVYMPERLDHQPVIHRHDVYGAIRKRQTRAVRGHAHVQ